MIASSSGTSGDRRLEQLYEISKLFAGFDVVEHTLDAALKVVANKLPLESAILVEAVIGGHTDMLIWPSAGSTPKRLAAAKKHAASTFAYLVGAPAFGALDGHDNVRQELGPTQLPEPDRGAEAPDDARRFIVIPLVVGRGAVFGALQLEGAAPLDRNDLEFVNAIANQLAIALDRNRAWGHDVVRRQEAQRQQARYEALVDHLDYAFVWEADAETRQISYVSAQLERMLGYTRQRCLHERDWWDAHVHPDDRDRLRQTFERATAEVGNKRCEHRFFAADGSLRWLRTSVHLVGDGGEPPCLQGVSFDITAARTAQEQVREQLSFTSAMASSLAEGTLSVDLDGRITFINDVAAGLLGTGDREMIGTPSLDVLHVETAKGALVESPLAAAIRTGRVRSESHVVRRIDGVKFPASYTATPIRRDGNVTGAVLAFDDISERRQSQDNAVFLLQARSMLSASLESTTVVNAGARLCVPLLCDVCFLDVVAADDELMQTAWAHVDPVIQSELDAMFGAAPRASMFGAVTAEVVTLGQSRWNPIIADAAVAPADLVLIRQLRIRSVLIVPLMLGARTIGALSLCLTGDRPRREGDVALAEELARRTANAIEHARLYEHARAAVSLREQTLAIVSHDLRSPLATIVMASSILADEDTTRSNPRSRMLAARKIQSAAERMDRMIEDLLDFANIEAGRLSMRAKPEEVGSIVAEATASFEAQASKNDVALTGVSAPGLPAILCDRDRILQVIVNLVSNAFKVVAPGAAVALSATRGEREVVFAVADTGRGISQADQKRLFERYWRSPDARYKGSGLGLGIARGLVEAHHGRLWVESEPGLGATFFFTVPFAD